MAATGPRVSYAPGPPWHRTRGNPVPSVAVQSLAPGTSTCVSRSAPTHRNRSRRSTDCQTGDELRADGLELGSRQDARAAWMGLRLRDWGGRTPPDEPFEHRDLLAQCPPPVGVGVRLRLVPAGHVERGGKLAGV